MGVAAITEWSSGVMVLGNDKADFYVGRDPRTMEWLGSVYWIGVPSRILEPILMAREERDYRNAVKAMLHFRTDSVVPAQGWPWPWEDSSFTDYVYAFEDGHVWVAHMGKGWVDAELAFAASRGEDLSPFGVGKLVWPETLSFPKMKAKRHG